MPSWIDYLLPPGFLLVLLALGFLLWRWRRPSRALVVAAGLLLLVSSVPSVGDLLLWPLAGNAPTYDPEVQGPVNAIVVPTAGNFEDAQGRWWPTQPSLVRATAGLRLQRKLGVPLILTGGSPLPDRPSEAETIAQALSLTGPEILLEVTARNSAESGPAVAALLRDIPRPRILLVTHPSHVARMSAVFRRQGIAVLKGPALQSQPWSPWRLIPSYAGLKTTRSALREYLGIAWYWLRGDITLADLSAGEF